MMHDASNIIIEWLSLCVRSRNDALFFF